jgi:hypothetical protein
MLRRSSVVVSYGKGSNFVNSLLCSAVIAIGMIGVSFAVAPPASAAPIPPASETVKVEAAPSRLAPFDTKQCYDDNRGCQLATCVSTATLEGPIVICQSHGNSFP